MHESLSCYPLQWVVTQVINFPTYEGLPNLASFISKFEDKLLEPQCLLELEEALKATLERWRDTYKDSMGY